MAKSILAFRGAPDRAVTPDDEAAWVSWLQEIGPNLADFGHRVVETITVTSHGEGSTEGGLVLTGYVIAELDDLANAVELAKGCPGLRTGGSVEVGVTA